MKIKISNQQQGIVLATTLMTVLILAIIVASYISLVNNEYVAVERSQSWNQAIPVLEGGVEEALTQLYLVGTNTAGLTANNWALGADGLYHKTRSYTDGSYCNVSIQAVYEPVITSTGYVVFNWNGASAVNYVSRKVKVVTKHAPATPGGMNAINTISFTGGATFDSFNSFDPNYSTGGLYDPTKAEANAEATSDSSVAGAVSVGTGTIYGSVNTGPLGTVTTGGSGAVGDAAWDASNKGIESGHSANNANVQFNDVAAPFVFGTATTPTSSTYFYLGTNYSYRLSGGNYNISSLTIGGGQSMLVTSTNVLYISGSASAQVLKVNGSGYIYMAPGATLQIYVNGGEADLSAIANSSSWAGNLTIYGMTNCNTIKLTGGSAFIGTIYAPEAFLEINGSGSATGAFTANSILVSGSGAVHFDESLENTGKAYEAISWNEF